MDLTTQSRKIIIYAKHEKWDSRVNLAQGNMGLRQESNANNLEKNEAEKPEEYEEEKVINEDK